MTVGSTASPGGATWPPWSGADGGLPAGRPGYPSVMSSDAPESPTPTPSGDDSMDDYPGTSPDEGRLEAEEMDGDSDGGDSRQPG